MNAMSSVQSEGHSSRMNAMSSVQNESHSSRMNDECSVQRERHPSRIKDMSSVQTEWHPSRMDAMSSVQSLWHSSRMNDMSSVQSEGIKVSSKWVRVWLTLNWTLRVHSFMVSEKMSFFCLDKYVCIYFSLKAWDCDFMIKQMHAYIVRIVRKGFLLSYSKRFFERVRTFTQGTRFSASGQRSHIFPYFVC